FRTQGAFTDNARTDVDYTITLPNHTTQLTGRPVLDRLGTNSGHKYTNNVDPASTTTLQTNAGYYIASAFDVAHDNGLKTAMYATKSKFVLYNQTYSATAGALDTTGADNGRKKIDVYVNPNQNSTSMMTSLVSNMSSAATRTNYTFVHFHDPDTAGHASTWDTSEPPPSNYMNAVRSVDGYLGQLFNLIQNDTALNGRSTILLTADHGGELGTGNHFDQNSAQDYTIPFYAWGAGVTPGDLYAMNAGVRSDPGALQPLYTAGGLQPIRNGDIGNLSLSMLGLGAVPGSSINASQTMIVPEPSSMAVAAVATGLLTLRRRRRLMM
ncbi:MAG TPA: alkaline phosphatase family protein, partial [Tepidisphaeraceae bacterium]